MNATEADLQAHVEYLQQLNSSLYDHTYTVNRLRADLEFDTITQERYLEWFAQQRSGCCTQSA